jgi:hypothetical protein
LLRNDNETVVMHDESDDDDSIDRHSAQHQGQSGPHATAAPSTSRARFRSVRIPDSDVDDTASTDSSEEDEDTTLAQNVPPPAYFPPIDLEAWNAEELRKLQMLTPSVLTR